MSGILQHRISRSYLTNSGTLTFNPDEACNFGTLAEAVEHCHAFCRLPSDFVYRPLDLQALAPLERGTSGNS